MGRNPKQGLDYFQADVDIFQDRKIKRLLRSAGSKGFTIYIYLLTYIYRDRGYYYEWDEHSAFDISDDLNFSENVVEESVKACCSIGLFNQDLFSAKSVLTSESIQQRWQRIVKDANRVNTKINAEYKIIDKKPLFLREKNQLSGEETPQKSGESTQSKEKESKEKESSNARPRVGGCPIPEPLQIEGFKERYEEYWEYMQETYRKQSNIRAVQAHFRKLIELQQAGNSPLKVIDQTMAAGNKSFYPLKDQEFESKSEDNGKSRTDKFIDRGEEFLEDLPE